MIFYCDLQGNLKAFQNETVYQGSNNVTTIYVVAPFSRPVGLNISFTKPNKLVTSPAIMKWVGTLGNVKIPVSFVNIPEQFTDTYNVWAYALPYSITEQNGVVGVSVNAVIADSVDASGQQAYKGNLTTFTGQFTVAYSALPSPPTDIPTEWTQDKVLDLLNNYYNDAIQKIGEMNTLKTDVKDTLVKAINEVFDEIATTNATIGDLSNLTTDEKTTIVGAINEVDAHSDANKTEMGNLSALTTDEKATLVGAINEVDNHADNAIGLANNAVATANSAVATANEAKTTAQTAENNANSAVDKADSAIDRANKAYEKAANNVYAVGFMTLQEAITAVNGYDNTVLKTNDNILVVAQGSPDLYVTSVEATNIPYNFTTVDKFNDDLVKNTVLQIGYYKVAFYETDGQPVTVAYQNVVVKSTDWVASTEFADFPYEAKIPLSNFVDYKTVPQVVFDIADTMSGNYAPICKSGDKCVYIYGKVQNEITLKTVITFAPNVNGASVTGGGYNNRGKWVASTTYAIDDLVYTDNGQYVCIEGITSTTSPEQDTTHWQATFVATGTVPEALPQEASALKSGNLPTSGWISTSPLIGSYKAINAYHFNNFGFIEGNKYTITYKLKTSSALKTETVTAVTRNYLSNPAVYTVGIAFEGGDFYVEDGIFWYVQNNGFEIDRTITNQASLRCYKDVEIINITEDLSNTVYHYTISDTSITTNSDILMELTDEGGVKSYSMEAGKITVIRDTVPTQPIPYTYKVKQTNTSGQFTLVNHFVPTIPETPTALPQEASALKSGNLPTSGWNTLAEGWKGNTLPAQRNWETVAYGGGKYVAVALGTDKGAYSTNGISWTEMTMPANRSWQSITYGNGKFVAVANSTYGAYSTDGINWTEMTMPADRSWQVTYGNGKFVAVGYSSNKGAYSTDGKNWTETSLPTGGWWRITYGDNKFVIVSDGGNDSTDKGAYSTDGITWTAMTMPTQRHWRSVTYGDGKFVAVAEYSTDGAYSTDGITWTRTTMEYNNWRSVTYGNGRFIAVVYDSGYGAYSIDGISWTAFNLPANRKWQSVTYGNGKFVAVAYNSANGAYWKAAADITYTISDTSITANSDVLMELTDDGGVKAYSMEAGKMTVIRDTVPTAAIPYTYKVKQTNASGQFTLVNHYVPNVPVTSVNGQTGAVTIAVPTKTSQLTNDSGFITAADIPTVGEWVTVTGTTATLTEAGTYQVIASVNDMQSIVYWDGSTVAYGTKSTTPSVSTSGGTAYLFINCAYPQIDASGTLSVHLLTAGNSSGAWAETDTVQSGFKYRKIN